MLTVVTQKKTEVHTVTYMKDSQDRLWLHFNRNDGTKSYLIPFKDI